ncbi:MAG: response regulator transcription factor [Nitriliruptorales bacterium]
MGRSRTLADALSHAFEQTGYPALAASREDVLAVVAGARVSTVVVDADGDSESVIQVVDRLRHQLGDVDVILLVSERGPSLLDLVTQTRARGSITRDVDPSRFVKAVIAGGTSPDGLSVRPATALGSSANPLAGLTERQREVLAELLTGGSDAQMAARLGLSAYTVRTHIQNVFSKLGVKTRFEAAAIALQAGLRPPEDSRP